MNNDRDILQEVLSAGQPEVATQEKTVKEEVETTEEVEETKPEEPEETKEAKPEETEEVKEETETEEDVKAEEVKPEETEEVKDEVKEEVKPLDEELISLAKEIVPDTEFKDKQEAITAIKEVLKEKNEFIEKSEKWNNELINLFENNPEVAEFTKAIINGMDSKVAAGIYISETLAPEDGEEGVNAYQEEVKKRKEAGEQRKKLEKEFSDNVAQSSLTVREFQKENAIEQSELDAILKEVDDELSNLRKGIVTKSYLQMVIKGKRFDAKLKKAEEQAYLRGKNEKIVLTKTKKNKGDGMPDIKSSLSAEKEKRQPDMLDRVLSHKATK